MVQNMDLKLTKLKQGIQESLNLVCELKQELCAAKPSAADTLRTRIRIIQSDTVKIDSLVR